MEQNQQFTCSGDCLKCSIAQRQYCSCQHSYNTLRMLQSMQESINSMSGTVDELKAKVSAIQDSEASIFDPSSETLIPKPISVSDEIAQNGDGATE